MTNPFSLEGKTILVTGASSGIGRGIAIACARMGAKVVLNGRNIERLHETLAMMDGEGHIVYASNLDKQEDLERMAQELPVIHGWANSAGIPKISPIKYFDRKNIDEIFNTNIVSSMLLLSLLLKKRKLSRGSSVVFIASISGNFVGSVGDTSYCASKGAVGGFMRGAALELAAQGIRVNCVSPGLVPTAILGLSNELAGEEDHHIKVATEKYPLKRLGTPEDIGNGVVYLLSDASSWVTGQNIAIDGGYTIY